MDLLPAELPDELKEAYGTGGAMSGVTASCFVMGNGQVEVDEHGKYALTIYRLGNTDKESSVSVKSIDYSALYGKDYKISDGRYKTEVFESEMSLMEMGALQENQEANAEALKQMLEMDGKPVEDDSTDLATPAGTDRQAVSAYVVPVGDDISDETVTAETDAVKGAGSQAQAKETQAKETPAKETPAKETQDKEASLVELKQAETGLPTREPIEDAETNQSAITAIQGMIAENGIMNAGDHLDYSSITKIPFAAGETEKQLIFEVLEDKESEGEELIQFSIVDPAEGDLVMEPNMSTVVIKDDEPKQRSSITFSDASYEADGAEANVKILKEGAPYNMVTFSVSVKNLNMKDDYTVKEMGFSPFVTENKINLKFKLGDKPMDYEMELRDILGGDEGRITKATLHVPAKSGSFLDASIGQNEDADSDTLDAAGHDGAPGWQHYHIIRA